MLFFFKNIRDNLAGREGKPIKILTKLPETTIMTSMAAKNPALFQTIFEEDLLKNLDTIVNVIEFIRKGSEFWVKIDATYAL